ncbi:hypothetical protein GKZ28_08945 [Clostridium chromiireducens]|uniref:Uncharacterized protein n=1 Tax=Clostridium chromiireducens TaxID=225345 RepID=A0A964W240_9CLOT|nr:DUF6171 family protein [Clostridium chromiireducens]MVX63820.1 hypothetical protein [Clostridium chromiireducens]
MKQRFCKKCLLDELFEEKEYQHLQDYIRNLDNNIKTEDEEYKKRLDVCKQCDNLINGMCKICGCFVEMRAAVKKNYCPNIEKYW